MVDVVNRQPEKANNKAKTTTIKHTIVDVVIRIGQPEVATEQCQQINTNNDYNKYNSRYSQQNWASMK